MPVSPQDDDVVYVGTTPKKRQPTNGLAWGRVGRTPTHARQTRSRRSANNPSGHPHRKPSTKPAAHAKRLPRTSKSPRTAAPPAFWRRLVKLGHPRGSGGRQKVVYGSFDRAGRFYRRVGTEELNPSGRPKRLEASPIKHEEVIYCPRLQHMTAAEVQREVRRFLESRIQVLDDEGVM